MTRLRLIALVLSLAASAASASDWVPVARGVDYRYFGGSDRAVHVVRVDLQAGGIRVIASSADDSGSTTSGFAERVSAIAAINGDYFTGERQPVGLAIGTCGAWPGTADTEREGVVAVGEARVEIHEQKRVLDPIDGWIAHAVSGWPLIVGDCRPFTDEELPGSDHFTRAPHPRTAVGTSREGDLLFLVVADGRRPDAPGLTLGELARFMREELGVCRALNLDGGGSSALVLHGRLMNRPSDGSERPVANHLAVVPDDVEIECPVKSPEPQTTTDHEQPTTDN